MNKIGEIKELVGITHFNNNECYSIHVNDNRVFAYSWNQDKDDSGFKGEINNKQLIKLIEGLEGRSEKNQHSLQIITDDYLFLVLYPPYVSDYYVTINKLGPDNLPYSKISELWKSRSPFSVNSNELKYYGENLSIETDNFNGNLQELQRVFDRNADKIESRQGLLEGTRYATQCHIITLSNGDMVTTYYNNGPIKIDYFPKM